MRALMLMVLAAVTVFVSSCTPRLTTVADLVVAP